MYIWRGGPANVQAFNCHVMKEASTSILTPPGQSSLLWLWQGEFSTQQ